MQVISIVRLLIDANSKALRHLRKQKTNELRLSVKRQLSLRDRRSQSDMHRFLGSDRSGCFSLALGKRSAVRNGRRFKKSNLSHNFVLAFLDRGARELCAKRERLSTIKPPTFPTRRLR